jgi:hypothetical protein
MKQTRIQILMIAALFMVGLQALEIGIHYEEGSGLRVAFLLSALQFFLLTAFFLLIYYRDNDIVPEVWVSD